MRLHASRLQTALWGSACFSINATNIEYVKQNKYLGFTIDSNLTDSAHIRDIFTKFRKAILIFKSTVRVSKVTLLKRFARTYILPTLHSLEFVQKFSTANISRFDFLMAKFFNVDKAKFDTIRGDTRWLSLPKILEDAQKRFEDIE